MPPPSASTASTLGTGHASPLAPQHLPVDPDHPSAITLNYHIVDNEFNSLGFEFIVTGLLTRRIGNVMQSILAESTDVLGDINAASLALWKPAKPPPFAIDDEETSTLDQLLVALRSNPKSVAQRLKPNLFVSKYFDKESLSADDLHLIVQAPISSNGETTRAKKRKRKVAEDSAERPDFHDGED